MTLHHQTLIAQLKSLRVRSTFRGDNRWLFRSLPKITYANELISLMVSTAKLWNELVQFQRNASKFERQGKFKKKKNRINASKKYK